MKFTHHPYLPGYFHKTDAVELRIVPRYEQNRRGGQTARVAKWFGYNGDTVVVRGSFKDVKEYLIKHYSEVK